VRGTLVFFAVLVGWSVPARANPTADDVMDRVKTFYGGVGQATAKFKQTIERATFQTRDVSAGIVRLQKPRKMRWEFASKKATVRREVIANGKRLWIVDKENKTITIASAATHTLPAAVSFLGKRRLQDDFTGSLSTAANGDLVLALTPKKPHAAYKKVTLVVAPDNHRVKRSIVQASNDDVTTLEFFEPDFETAIDRRLFVVEPKRYPGYATEILR
jgi:outer membrane lipoprotein-sorting protein